MMKLRSFCASLAIVLCALSVPSAHAQLAVYGMGSVGFLGASPIATGTTNQQKGGFTAGGFTLGVYDDFAKIGPLNFGIDGRYFKQTSGNNNSYGNKINGGLVGARLALKLPILPVKPYVQAEGGIVGTNYGTNANTTDSGAWQISGGIDFTVLPHIDLRAEYGGGMIGAYNNGNQGLQELGGGAVFRF